jgi:hypothetical protein
MIDCSGFAPVSTTTSEDYRPFPVDLLPGVVGQFTTEAAAAIGCDPAHCWSGVDVVSRQFNWQQAGRPIA